MKKPDRKSKQPRPEPHLPSHPLSFVFNGVGLCRRCVKLYPEAKQQQTVPAAA